MQPVEVDGVEPALRGGAGREEQCIDVGEAAGQVEE
jgi:hypothetical protein